MDGMFLVLSPYNVILSLPKLTTFTLHEQKQNNNKNSMIDGSEGTQTYLRTFRIT